MNIRRLLLIAALTLALPSTLFLRAEEGDTYDEGYEPNPPAPFPVEFKNFQILPESISPDAVCGLIYPKHSVLFDMKATPLYLVQLNPFSVMKQLLPDANLSGNHASYDVKWAENSSLVMITEGGKWGPHRVVIAQVLKGKAGKVTDLTAEIRKQLQPYYEKAKAKAGRYNDYFDYIFDSDSPEGWRINNHGTQIDIWCTCTTDPKPPRGGAWVADFEGLWDISKNHFLQSKVTAQILPPDKDSD